MDAKTFVSLLQDEEFNHAFNQFMNERLGSDVTELDEERHYHFDRVAEFVPEEHKEIVSQLDESIGACLAEKQDFAYKQGLKDGARLLLELLK